MMIALLFAVISLGTITPGFHAEAASLTNVTKAPKAKKGQWVISSKGYRYRYTASKKYAKSVWLKINGEIYYFKSNGYLQTGWKTYNKKKYYFDNTGALVTGWKKIGNNKYYLWKKNGSAATGKVKIAGKYYYFTSAGVMKTGWRKIGGYYYYFSPSNGSMAVNTTIGKYRVDQNGRRVTAVDAATADPTQPNNTITNAKTGKVDYFVGDSRTVGMGNVMKISSKCIASVGQGYSWYVSTAEPRLKSKLKKNPTATVVINLGVNDYSGNTSKYVNRYKKLLKAYPKARIFFMSVNPIDSKYSGWCTNAGIQKFNAAIKKAFPDRYIDCYTYLKKKGFSTVDGLHYTTATYKKIYKYILTQV